MTLPLIHRGARGRALAGGYLAFCALYLLAGRAHWTAPALLEPGAVDRRVPFLDWTIAVYLSQFGLLACAVACPSDDARRSRAFWAMLLATLLASSVFLIWPTALARAPLDAASSFAPLWQALYTFDAPTNSFPSLHVALALIAALALAPEGRAWRLVAPLWAAAIAFSTLTTKQHVLFDVAGGLATGAASALALRRMEFATGLYRVRRRPAHG